MWILVMVKIWYYNSMLKIAKTILISLASFLLPFLSFSFLLRSGLSDVFYFNYFAHSILLLSTCILAFYTSYVAYRGYLKNKNVRIFIISLAFYIFGFVFFVHAMSIPGLYVFGGTLNNAIFDITEHYGLLFGALILFGLVLPVKRFKQWIFINKRKIYLIPIISMLLGFIFLVISPEIQEVLEKTMEYPVVLTGIFFFSSLVFLIHKYSDSKSILLLYLIIGFSILINTSIIPFFYQEWSILWWYFHFIFLLGFVVISIGVVKSKINKQGFETIFDEIPLYFKIGTRLWAWLVLIFLLLIILGGTNYNRVQSLQEAFEKVQEESQEMHKIMNLTLSINQSMMPVNDYLVANLDINEKENFLSAISKVKVFFEKMKPLAFNNPEEKELFISAINYYSLFEQTSLQIFDTPQQKAIGSIEIGLLMKKADLLGEQAIKEIEKWHTINDKEIIEAEKNFTQIQKEVAYINSILILFVILISLILGVIFIRSITKPIAELAKTAQAIAGGNLNRRAKILSKGEIGQLAKIFNQMTEALIKANSKFKENNLELTIKILESEELTKNLQEAKMATLNILEDLKVEKVKADKEAENAKKFQQAVEASSDGIAISDIDANIIYANPAWEKTTGYKLKEVLGKNLRILQSGKTPKRVYKEMWDTLIIGKSFITEDIVNKRKDGSEYPEHISITPIMSYRKTIFYVSISQDITKRKEVDKMKSEFITIASHQLRTPLTSIRWVIELFLKKEKLSKQGKEYLNDVHTSAQRLSDLVDILLNVSRIEEGGVGISPRPLELVSFINGYLGEIKPLSDKKNISIKFKHPKKLEILTDESTLRNIIQSLISNAMEYTPKDGKVDINLVKNEHEFYLKISDTGIGIPKDEQEHIAQKFTRGSNAMLVKTDGTGMGLYIAYRAVELLGGKIWFESEEKKGTTFSITLPIESEEISGTRRLV